LSVLQFVWPWVLGFALLLGAIVWGLRQTNSSDIRAAAGALAIWIGENAAGVAFLSRGYSRGADPDDFIARVRPAVVKRWRLLAVAMNVGPGLWIGLVSRDAVATAAATRVAISLIWRLSSRLPPAERERIITRAYLERFCVELAAICFAALIGSLLRSL
jgi:hypothetical protein